MYWEDDAHLIVAPPCIFLKILHSKSARLTLPCTPNRRKDLDRSPKLPMVRSKISTLDDNPKWGDDPSTMIILIGPGPILKLNYLGYSHYGPMGIAIRVALTCLRLRSINSYQHNSVHILVKPKKANKIGNNDYSPQISFNRKNHHKICPTPYETSTPVQPYRQPRGKETNRWTIS